MSEQYFTQELLIKILFLVSVSPATYLAAYIINVILVLYEISMVVTVDPPRSLSPDLVMDALAVYRARSSRIHAQVMGFTFKLEEKVATIIQDALPPTS